MVPVLDRKALNESPSEKEGKSGTLRLRLTIIRGPLNESPSEKEGKYGLRGFFG